LLAASAEGISLEEQNPSLAAIAGRSLNRASRIDLGKISELFRKLSERFDSVIVEGVGGWLVPITADRFVSDFAKQLELPVAIVANNQFGCLIMSCYA
jgi:dethiobiotin synthetase